MFLVDVVGGVTTLILTLIRGPAFENLQLTDLVFVWHPSLGLAVPDLVSATTRLSPVVSGGHSSLRTCPGHTVAPNSAIL